MKKYFVVYTFGTIDAELRAMLTGKHNLNNTTHAVVEFDPATITADGLKDLCNVALRISLGSGLDKMATEASKDEDPGGYLMQEVIRQAKNESGKYTVVSVLTVTPL